MDIKTLENLIKYAKKEGYKYISINDLGINDFLSSRFSRKPINGIENIFYTSVFNYRELKKGPKKVIQGQHFEIIKSEIVSADFGRNAWGDDDFDIVFDLKPLEPLPDWMDESDKRDCFENIDFAELNTNKVDITTELREIMELDLCDHIDIVYT